MEREERRLEQFRRLRTEIRGSQDYLVVGIDISKDIHNALMRTTGGKILYRRLTLMKKQERFDPNYLAVQIAPIAAGNAAKSRNRGIPEVQPNSDRGL